MTRPVFVLYRPWAPSVRAQTVQVLHAAHGLAAHRPVTVCVRPSEPTSAEAVLQHQGLSARPGLRLHVLPAGGTASSLAFRAQLLAWRSGPGRQGVGLSRTPRYARWLQQLGRPVVVEAHGLADDADAEARALRSSCGLICNSHGTLGRLRARHGLLPPAQVIANATRGPGPALTGPGEGIGYVGSVRTEKGLQVLADLAEQTSEPVVVVTPEPERARRLGAALQVEGPVPPHEVGARLSRFRVLVLPLEPGPFGDVETCPLKLFDYLASGRPVVLADTGAVRALVPAVVPAWVPRFRPGDTDSLRSAIARATSAPRVARFAARPLVRTWADRAVEVHRALERWAP